MTRLLTMLTSLFVVGKTRALSSPTSSSSTGSMTTTTNVAAAAASAAAAAAAAAATCTQGTKKWLIVGDGDLSYAASMAQQLMEERNTNHEFDNNRNTSQESVQLIATVWEDADEHQRIYQRSRNNTATIQSASTHHSVLFGIDATQLSNHFPSFSSMSSTTATTTKFDVIDFNFPHWKGKTNAKRNRELLDRFFRSASSVLAVASPANYTMGGGSSVNSSNNNNNNCNNNNGNGRGGEIRVALHRSQGGFPSSSLQEWRQSWLVATIAAQHGLLLTRLEDPFRPQYFQSSHRGMDRPWKKDNEMQRYIFSYPYEDMPPVDPSLQIACRHELRIMLHEHKLAAAAAAEISATFKGVVTRRDIVDGDAVYQLAQRMVPDGIRFEIPARTVLMPYQTGQVALAVFLLNYSGERRPLTRELADDIRANVEAAIQQEWKLDVAKGGRMVSRPYPYHLLPQLIKEYNNIEDKK